MPGLIKKTILVTSLLLVVASTLHADNTDAISGKPGKESGRSTVNMKELSRQQEDTSTHGVELVHSPMPIPEDMAIPVDEDPVPSYFCYEDD